MWGKPGNCENRPTNVEVSKIIELFSSPIFVLSITGKSIKITSVIHI